MKSKDTSKEVQERYDAMVMALSPGQRVALGCRMFNSAKDLALAGLANEPNPNGLSLKARLFLRLYGRDFSTEESARIIASLDGGGGV